MAPCYVKLDISGLVVMDDWSTLLISARRMANLTQEDFAADLGVARVTLAHWENGRRPVPSKVRRRILDFMGGYYHNRPEFKNVLASAEKTGAFVTLYQSGLIIRGATDYARRMWGRARSNEMVGQHIFPVAPKDMKLPKYYDIYYKHMLNDKSEIASVSYFDKSFLFPDRFVKARVSAVTVGEGRILCVENSYLPVGTEGESYLAEKARIITMDGVEIDG